MIDENTPEPGDLAASFARLIASTGPMSIAQFMGEANAHYYASRDPLGADGDFITAPEISQMFGEMVGLWCAHLALEARIARFHYVELGPGRGTLARDALAAMARFGLKPDVHLIEGSPALQAVQRGLGLEARWHDSIETVPNDAPMIVIANEFFDALPVRQLVKTGGHWAERGVDFQNDIFVPVATPRLMDAAIPAPIRAQADQAEDGAILELHPAAAAIGYEIAHRISQQGGAALFIDYGYADLALGSSLQAVKKHFRVDPFIAPGTADLTAHVDFGELARIAASHGLTAQGPANQGDWLMALGLAVRAERLIAANPDHADSVTAALHRLTDSSEMGELFKVLALRHPNWPESAGF